MSAAFVNRIQIRRGGNNHILLEVPPKPKAPLTDEQLLKRIGALYSKAYVATVAKELADARQVVSEGRARDGEAYVQQILERLSSGRDVALRRMLRWKVRYFSDGAAVGSRAFVDGLFEQCRERFGSKRKSGARKMRGHASGAAGFLWSARDLRVEVS